MLISLAIDHHRSDLATRERLARSAQGSGLPSREALTPPLEEFLLLSTCNRFELYGWADRDPAVAFAALAMHWPQAPETRALLSTAIRRSGDAAREHLLRVAVGLESQVAGDGHVLAQVRRAYTEAVERGTVGPALHQLLQAALSTGRRVRRDTGFTRRGQSAATEAAALISRRAQPERPNRVVILGAGKMACEAARRLQAIAGVELVIVNRSAEGAHALAVEVAARPATLDALHTELAEADFAVLASAAPRPLVLAEALTRARASAERQGPLLLVDLGLPRNAAAGVRGIPGVELVDLEQLGVAETAPGAAERGAAEAIVAAALDDLRRRRAMRILEGVRGNSTERGHV